MSRVALVVGSAVLALAGCASVASPPQPAEQPRRPVVVTLPGPGDRYAAAVDSAVRHGLEVWLEADLLARWLDGPEAFEAAVARVAALASRPGVVGVKVADELGYRDGVAGRPSAALDFLRAVDRALAASSPEADLLVDLYVPLLGCAPGLRETAWVRACRARAQRDAPGLGLEQVDSWIASRAVDVVNLSTGLGSDASYASRGSTRDEAQALAWQEVRRRGWPRDVRMRARKALAHTGRYTGSPSQAEADLRTWVDVPSRHGATGVDIWTWRQTYRGEVVRLMDPGLVPNSLYAGLARRRAEGLQLSTHLTPSSLEHHLEVDMTALARAFSAVFVAAGTG